MSENHAYEEVLKFNDQRFESVRYEVKPPSRKSAENLGESYSSALKMLHSLQPRFISPLILNMESGTLISFMNVKHSIICLKL